MGCLVSLVILLAAFFFMFELSYATTATLTGSTAFGVIVGIIVLIVAIYYLSQDHSK